MLLIGAISYRKTGQGLGFLNYEEYKTFVVSLKGNVWTKTIGEMPLPSEIKPVEHRPGSAYYNLDHNEKILYDALLTRSYQILRGVDLTTDVNVPLDDMEFGGFEDCKTYDQIKEKIMNKLSEIDYEAVYRSMHLDYEYLL